MFVVLVKLNAHTGTAARLGRMLKSQAAESLKREPGCTQFDVLGDAESCEDFLLYEVYTSLEAFDEHLSMDHTTAFLAEAGSLIRSKEERHFLPI